MMVKLCMDQLSDDNWESTGVVLPKFDVGQIRQKTVHNPKWVHIALGNIARAYISELAQDILESTDYDSGIVGIETYDPELVETVYEPHDYLTIQAVMHPDGSKGFRLLASVAQVLKADDREAVEAVSTNADLQMVSITCTEKGYALPDEGDGWAEVVEDPQEHAMGFVAEMLYQRYVSGARPIALVSMDNISHNGTRFRGAVEKIAEARMGEGYYQPGFEGYLEGCSFPTTMIDRITPRPDPEVAEILREKGVAGMEIIETAKHSFAAPFVNTEEFSLLVVEDDFPNGRPPLQEAGVLFENTAAEVAEYEQMKVSTCLNPLHTTIATMGCLLEHERVHEAVADEDLRRFLSNQGEEALEVVVTPNQIKPREFYAEVFRRFENPGVPDTPARIATDTSQKVQPRYGWTIQQYNEREDLSPQDLTYIPLAIAAWLRYLCGAGKRDSAYYGVSDKGNRFELSPDPLMDDLQEKLSGVEFGNPDSVTGARVAAVIEQCFRVDLYDAGVGQKVEKYLKKMLEGPGALLQILQTRKGDFE